MVIEMTNDELGTIRYALNTGVEKLASEARFMHAIKSDRAATATETANLATIADADLEAAVQAWAHRPGK